MYLVLFIVVAKFLVTNEGIFLPFLNFLFGKQLLCNCKQKLGITKLNYFVMLINFFSPF
jgi:hypothetical protein